MYSVNDTTGKRILIAFDMDKTEVGYIETKLLSNVHRFNSIRKDRTKYEHSDGFTIYVPNRNHYHKNIWELFVTGKL